ncbi:anti-sigma factor family protein [Desulfoluna spongiiphila]|uniref:Putative zinc-finger n=1 Tax=Desulfoluna spongiiphila TaxID=419481 RepID=A0A1G5AFC9_9BACT|nr:zf-HC2 domain-containing protein [Desulfoluna spongiiphila]SCX76600.1 Putative zinc-finger [Desulfoluna spongiiphila]
MEHPQEKELHAYVDKTLDPQGEKAMDAHLAHCPCCRREVDELGLLFHELKHLSAPPPDRGMVTRILLSREREDQNRPLTLDLFRLLFGRMGWAAVAVGLVVGGILGYSALPDWKPYDTDKTAPYTLAAQEDPYLGYLISDNGDLL